MSEKLFMRIYPQAEPVLDWCDFKIEKVYVDVKECFQNSWGRYHFFFEYHQQLVDSGGLYFFALKRRIQNSNPRLLDHIKWIPACTIQIDEDSDSIETVRSHKTGYEWREQFRIHWKEIWPELIPNGKP